MNSIWMVTGIFLACGFNVGWAQTVTEIGRECAKAPYEQETFAKCITAPQTEAEKEERRFQERLKVEVGEQINSLPKAPADEEARYRAWRKRGVDSITR